MKMKSELRKSVPTSNVNTHTDITATLTPFFSGSDSAASSSHAREQPGPCSEANGGRQCDEATMQPTRTIHEPQDVEGQRVLESFK